MKIFSLSLALFMLVSACAAQQNVELSFRGEVFTPVNTQIPLKQPEIASRPSQSQTQSAPVLRSGQLMRSTARSQQGELTGYMLVRTMHPQALLPLNALMAQPIGKQFVLLQFAPEDDLLAKLQQALALPEVEDAELEINVKAHVIR